MVLVWPGAQQVNVSIVHRTASLSARSASLLQHQPAAAASHAVDDRRTAISTIAIRIFFRSFFCL